MEKTLTCVGADCCYSRSYLEPYTDFSVDLVDPSGNGGNGDALLLSLDEAEGSEGGIPLQAFDLLAHCFQEQELELACEQCRKQNRVRVSYRFRRLPHLLVLHLKRFKVVGATAAGLAHQKLQTRVMAPASLDIAQFCDEFTLNPRNVDKGLGGAAAPDVTGLWLAALAPPPTAGGAGLSPLLGGTGSGGKGNGKMDGYLSQPKGGAAGAGAGKDARGKPVVPNTGIWGMMRQKRAGDGAVQEEDRWTEEEEEEAAAAASSGGKKRKSEEPLGDAAASRAKVDGVEVLDLVRTGSLGSQDAADLELQEALRQSLAEEQARKALVGLCD